MNVLPETTLLLRRPLFTKKIQNCCRHSTKSNDVDLFTNDLGLIAIIENNELKGFNLVVGGGLGAYAVMLLLFHV